MAKPLLIILTPIGVAGGLYEAYRFGSGLALLMLALITFIGIAVFSVVRTIRRERRKERELRQRLILRIFARNGIFEIVRDTACVEPLHY